MIPNPSRLGLIRTLEFSSAPQGKTFYYAKRRKEPHGGHLPVIESRWEESERFRRTTGPFIYVVTGTTGQVKYIGKSLETYLYMRWLRPQPYIHHRESRDYILSELRAGQGPLHLWSANAAELKQKVSGHASLSDREFVTALEALWLSRWRSHLWNGKLEPLVAGFSDNEYWRQGSTAA